jgi:pimeloyl-ACP methyl ester carboxylesterase
MTAITFDGDLVHYEVLGRGRPVILLHGMLGSWRYWVPTITALQQNFRVYAIDLYGFGDSARRPNKYTLEHQIALLEDFMKEMALAKAAFIGHDLGAIVAAEYARRHPDRAPRVVFISAPLFDPGDLEHRVPIRRALDTRPPTPPSSDYNAPTVLSPNTTMRKMLNEAMAQRQKMAGTAPVSVPAAPSPRPAPVEIPAGPRPSYPIVNPLKDIAALGLEPLLARCFRRGDPNYEKLQVEIARCDPAAVTGLIANFDAGTMLDTFRLLGMPAVYIHGLDDAVTPPPNDSTLQYLTGEREQTVLPLLLPGVRHFPMLEDVRFTSLVKDCLEAPDVSKIAVKERWVRRNR